MIKLITVFALAAIQVEGSTQSPSDQQIVRTEHFSRTLDLPDDIGFAIFPYVQCMSDEIQALWDAQTPLHENPEKVSEIKIACSRYRDEAIYLAATALERMENIEKIDQSHLTTRKEKIFSALASAEVFMLDTRDPSIILGLEE